MPDKSRYAAIVLCLAIANTLACSTAYYPRMQQIIKAEMYRHHTAAHWAVILNFVGVGLGLIWFMIVNKLGRRLTLVVSCLLLTLFTVLNTFIRFTPFNFLCGLLGSAPLYLAPEIFCSLNGGLGQRLGLVALSSLGGLIVGIFVGILGSPLILSTLSICIAALLFLTIEPMQRRDSAENTQPPCLRAHQNLFALFGACEGAFLGCFCSALLNLYLYNWIGRWPRWNLLESFAGILVGISASSIIQAGTMPPEKDGTAQRYPNDSPSLIGGAIAFIAQSTLVYNLYKLNDNYLHANQEYRFHVIFVAGLIWGYCLSGHFAESVAQRAELYSKFPLSISAVFTSAKYFGCSLVMVLVLGITKSPSKAILFLLYGGFPTTVGWVMCRFYIAKLSINHADLEQMNNAACLRAQIDALETRLRAVENAK